GDEHPVPFEIESDPDSFHQMSEQNVGRWMFAEVGVYRRAIDRVSTRRISAVGPINEPILQIELEIDRLRQAVEQEFDVGAVRRRLAFWDVNVRTEDAALTRVVRTFLRPVNLSTVRIDSDPNTPF